MGGGNQVLRFHPAKHLVFIEDYELGGRVEPVIHFNDKKSKKYKRRAGVVLSGVYGLLDWETGSTLPPKNAVVVGLALVEALAVVPVLESGA